MNLTQQQAITDVFKRIFERVPFYQSLYKQHGFHENSLDDISAFERLPFLEKKHFRETYPTGLLAVPKKEVVRYHASSGTSGLPTMVAYTQNDITHWSTIIADSLSRLGINQDSVVQNSYGYGMFTGGLGFHHGIEQLGATVIPASTGNTERQVLLMKDLGATVITATPSYLLHMYDYLVANDIPVSTLSLQTAIVGAEPWTEEMRKRIETNLNIKAYDVYGMSEAIGGGVSMECAEQNGLHVYEKAFYAEIINPDTGEVLPIGETGELVLTSLHKEALPIMRYRTGDITRLIAEPCACGHTDIRMAKPTGRVDDMVIIKGVNVFPSQIESVLLAQRMTNPHYQLVVERHGNHDQLTIRVEVDEVYHRASNDVQQQYQQQIKAKLHSVLGIKFAIEFLAPNTLTRSEGKTKRLIDLRE